MSKLLLAKYDGDNSWWNYLSLPPSDRSFASESLEGVEFGLHCLQDKSRWLNGNSKFIRMGVDTWVAAIHFKSQWHHLKGVTMDQLVLRGLARGTVES